MHRFQVQAPKSETSEPQEFPLQSLKKTVYIRGQEEPEFFPVHGGVDKSCTGLLCIDIGVPE